MIEKLRSYGIVVVFGLLFVILAISSPSFLSLQNAANILDQSSILFIMASVLTLCIIAGIFDLSVAAVATASAPPPSLLVQWQRPSWEILGQMSSKSSTPRRVTPCETMVRVRMEYHFGGQCSPGISARLAFI